jgi:aldehyde dehydrogenase (NAD+)
MKISLVNPANGKVICAVSEAAPADVDRAVAAARRAFETTWGLNTPGSERGRLMNKLADLMEAHAGELAAIEAFNSGTLFLLFFYPRRLTIHCYSGKTFVAANNLEIPMAIACIRYYAGWADKIQGKTMEAGETKFVYTRREPIGVCGLVIPWNFPCTRLVLPITEVTYEGI